MVTLCFSIQDGILKDALKELCPQAGISYTENKENAQGIVTMGPTSSSLPQIDLSLFPLPLSFLDLLGKLKNLPYAKEISFAHFSLDLREKNLKNLETHVTQKLTEKECQLLRFFHQNKGSEISRETLLKEIWGYHPHVQTHTIETHIYRLRQKLEEDPNDPKILLNCKEGYWIS